MILDLGNFIIIQTRQRRTFTLDTATFADIEQLFVVES